MEKIIYNTKLKKISCILLVIIMLFQLMMPSTVFADEEESDDESGSWGLLFSPFTSLLIGIADSVNWILQSTIVGGDDSASATKMRDEAVAYMEANDATGQSDLPIVTIKRSGIDNSAGGLFGIGSTYRIGTVRLTPAEIFAGRVTALNANFFKDTTTDSDMLGGDEKSIVNDLGNVVSSWYVAIRNISIVGLLSVLVYIGIRIIISSSVNDKAKYKQFFEDWLVALCLIFFMHYIMSFTMSISEQVTNMIANTNSGLNSDKSIRQCIIMLTDDDGNEIQESGSTRTWYSNFTNVARIKVQYDSMAAKLGYTTIYIGLTAYTVYFTIIYLKRLLMLAFYTLMAPAVALTYPIDKMKDGKAQAFNFWLKDYIFYALLQPLHMILYTVFVNSALELAVNNMLYAIVAMAFIVPAEKIVKQMFGIKGNTEDRAKGFAGGAVAGSIFSNAKKLQGGAGKSAPKDGGKASASNKIPTFKNENPPKTFDVMAEEAANKAKEDAEREKAEKEAAKQARQDAAADAARAAELEAERKAAEEARQMAEKASAEAAEANAENTQRTASEEQEAAQTGNSSQLTPEQLQELNNQGIAPGTPEYNQYLAEHGIENGTQTPEVEVSPSTPRQVANTPTTRQRRLLGQKGKARRALDYINNRATDAGGWGTIAKKAGLGAAKGLVKGYATIGTAAALGAAGVGIGAVGGDLSDVAKGLTAGVTTGAVIGKRTGKSITSGAGYVLDAAKGNNGLGRFKEEVWDGMTSEEMDKKQYVTAYTESKENRRRFLDKHPEIGELGVGEREKAIKAQMKQEAEMAYDTGITDYKTLREAVKLENSLSEQFGGATDAEKEANKRRAHDVALTTAKLSEDYDKKTFTSRKNLKDAKDSFVDRLLATPGSNLTEAQARAQADTVFANMKKMKGL